MMKKTKPTNLQKHKWIVMKTQHYYST